MTRIKYQECYQTVFRYFAKSSPLPTYFTVPDRSLFIIPKFIHYSMVPVFCLCLQCFDAVGWAAGRASGL